MTIPTIGRIVLYTLSQQDCAFINENRRNANLHGNTVNPGDVFPMIITSVSVESADSPVNGTVFLDGQDTLWVTSAHVGSGPHTFIWPVFPTKPVAPS